MPLARIDLVAGKPASYRAAVGDVVYDAMISDLNAPKDDRFQIITEHPEENLVVDPEFYGIHRSGDCILIQLTLNDGRTIEQKRAFYRSVADGLNKRLGCAARTCSSIWSKCARKTGRSGTVRRSWRRPEVLSSTRFLTGGGHRANPTIDAALGRHPSSAGAAQPPRRFQGRGGITTGHLSCGEQSPGAHATWSCQT